MQYTLRNIPEALDQAIRSRAKAEGKSLNEVALNALARGLGVTEEAVKYRNLADIAGTWVEDEAFEAALADQDTVDDELWR